MYCVKASSNAFWSLLLLLAFLEHFKVFIGYRQWVNPLVQKEESQTYIWNYSKNYLLKSSNKNVHLGMKVKPSKQPSNADTDLSYD